MTMPSHDFSQGVKRTRLLGKRGIFDERGRFLAYFLLALPIRSRVLTPTNGVTKDEIRAVLMQAGIYAGVPLALAAFRVAGDAINAWEEEHGAR